MQKQCSKKYEKMKIKVKKMKEKFAFFRGVGGDEIFFVSAN